MPAGSSVGWGGSMTLTESGLMDAVKAGDYVINDRETAKQGKNKGDVRKNPQQRFLF